jgi:ABC-type Fe3+/spermidine/putrescine transport system ATPase subunit
MTTLFVTHDQDEAMEVAKRVVIMNHGKVEQEGDPKSIFDNPRTQFVAEFVGETNSIEVTAEDDGLAVYGPLRFSIAPHFKKGRRIRIYFRPHDVYVTREKESLQVPATIVRERFKGAFTELDLDLGAQKHILAHLPRGLAEASGFVPSEKVWLGITGFHVFALDLASGIGSGA